MSLAALMNITLNELAMERLWTAVSTNATMPFASLYNVSNGSPINGIARCYRFQ